MFAPDVEARFKRIEDAQLVAAELLHRFERRTEERAGRLEALQDHMAVWVEEIETKLNRLTDAHIRSEDAGREMREAIAELSRTVDRFLKFRSDGESL